MLNLLDELLRHILLAGVDQLQPVASGSPAVVVTSDQVGFAPPDDLWRSAVINLQRNALNVYLVDLRENRKLRSNERDRRVDNSIAYDTPSPVQLDCHYLISAWSPIDIKLMPLIEPTLDEHIMLYQAAAALTKSAPFNPSRVHPAGSKELNAWPEKFRDSNYPAAILPSEGFPKIAEFWGAMGSGHRWKPVLYLIVTIPIELATQVAGPMVTTRITEYRQAGSPETAEVWVQIGGTVFDKTGRAVANAWVRLETITDTPLQTIETDEKGRFTFSNLQPGQYKLHARAAGKDNTIIVEVPSPTGNYDVHLS